MSPRKQDKSDVISYDEFNQLIDHTDFHHDPPPAELIPQDENNNQLEETLMGMEYDFDTESTPEEFDEDEEFELEDDDDRSSLEFSDLDEDENYDFSSDVDDYEGDLDADARATWHPLKEELNR